MEDTEIESLGRLKPHKDNPEEWLVSEPISVAFFNEKKLEFTLEYDLENDKNFLFNANKAIEHFLKKDVSDKTAFAHLVCENYKKVQNYYAAEPLSAPSLELSEESEIWEYVYPQAIDVCRGFGDDKNIYILISCECEWEEEHGLQLAFRNGLELTRVSDIDYKPTE